MAQSHNANTPQQLWTSNWRSSSSWFSTSQHLTGHQSAVNQHLLSYVPSAWGAISCQWLFLAPHDLRCSPSAFHADVRTIATPSPLWHCFSASSQHYTLPNMVDCIPKSCLLETSFLMTRSILRSSDSLTSELSLTVSTVPSLSTGYLTFQVPKYQALLLSFALQCACVVVANLQALRRGTRKEWSE